MKLVNFSFEAGNKYYGKIDGSRFFIGTRVPYDGGKGLQNLKGAAGDRYDREEYRESHGFWADFIHPTAMAEGGLYHTLNTYDRALFTFSFLQFAAHVPDGDFVVFLRALLSLPLATEYFPDLTIRNGRICRVSAEGDLIQLESSTSTAGLTDYLNPTRAQVEDTEVIQAAKFIHWVRNDPAHRRTQIDVGIELFKRNMAQYAVRYDLDGTDDVVCLLVADIRHQGRAKSAAIVAALQAANPVEALLKIGSPTYDTRLRTLRREIKALVDDGTLGTRKYDLAREEFIPA